MPPSRPLVIDVSDDVREDVVEPSASVFCVAVMVFVAVCPAMP